MNSLKSFFWIFMVMVVFSIPMGANALTVTEIAKLIAADQTKFSYFGQSVTSSGNLVVVGAPSVQYVGVGGYPYSPDGVAAAGSAYIFTVHSNGSWSQVAKLTANDQQMYDQFGSSVAVSGSGDTIVIGAPTHKQNGVFTGAAYVFRKNSAGNWIQQAKLNASDAQDTDIFFGRKVAISGNTIMVASAPTALNAQYFFSAPTGPGAVYVFTGDFSGNWSEQAKLTASNGAIGDSFGFGDLFGKSIAIDGDTAVIGACNCAFQNPNVFVLSAPGTAYVFSRDSNGIWTQQAELTTSEARIPYPGLSGDGYGTSVAISNNIAMIGDYWSLNNLTGAVYIFIRDNAGNWSQQQKLIPADISGWEESSNKHFGSSIALSNNLAVIGAAGDQLHGWWTGAAYMFTKNANGNWLQQAKLVASDGRESDEFGTSVSLSNNRVTVSAIQVNWPRREHPGAAYVYEIQDNPGGGEGACFNAHITKLKKYGFLQDYNMYRAYPFMNWKDLGMIRTSLFDYLTCTFVDTDLSRIPVCLAGPVLPGGNASPCPPLDCFIDGPGCMDPYQFKRISISDDVIETLLEWSQKRMTDEELRNSISRFVKTGKITIDKVPPQKIRYKKVRVKALKQGGLNNEATSNRLVPSK